MRVTAGRKHDAPACSDHNFPSVQAHPGTSYAAPVADETDERCPEKNRDVALAQAVEQPPDQRISHHDPGATPILHAVEDIAREESGGISEISERAVAVDQRRNVRLADHHPTEQHEFRYWRANTVKVRTEQTAVKRLGNDRATGNRCTRHVAAVIRMLSARKKPHLRAGGQVIDHFRPTLEKRAPERAVVFPDQCIEIAVRLLRAVGESGDTALAVAGNPERACRRRSGATDLIRLLAQNYIETFKRGDQRSRQTGGSCARYQQIDLTVAIAFFAHL